MIRVHTSLLVLLLCCGASGCIFESEDGTRVDSADTDSACGPGDLKALVPLNLPLPPCSYTRLSLPVEKVYRIKEGEPVREITDVPTMLKEHDELRVFVGDETIVIRLKTRKSLAVPARPLPAPGAEFPPIRETTERRR
jgi:hypothetical protein